MQVSNYQKSIKSVISYKSSMFFEYPETQCNKSFLLNLFETQKKICHQYIKIASKQLYTQEAHTISTANQLLERIASKDVVKDLSEWDVFSTRDSMVIEDDPSFNFSTLSSESRGKHIQRKSAMGNRPGKDLQGSLGECLQEIQIHCTTKTSSSIQKIVEENRKLKLRMFEIEKKEKNMKAREKLIQELQQKNAILSRRIEDAESSIEKLKNDNQTLKNNKSELSELLHQKNSQINSSKKIKLFQEIAAHQIPKTESHSANILQDIITCKEEIISSRMKTVEQLESKIEKNIFESHHGCQKCCQVLRKMKGSIMAYKSYLQKQGLVFQEMVDKFKADIFAQE